MNKDFQEAEDLMFEIVDELTEKGSGDTEVVICPPAVYLEMSSDIAAENGFMVGAQNLSQWESGAYTGEISASMLHSMGITHCILGHSERRTYFGETDKVIATKVDLTLKYGMTPIYCCGEVLAERQAEKHFEVVRSQVSEALFHLGNESIRQVIIAYEPVWAIGTGRVATPEQAQEVHSEIRALISGLAGPAVAAGVRILYGGSVKPDNVDALLRQPDLDGALVGGASLKATDFARIVRFTA